MRRSLAWLAAALCGLAALGLAACENPKPKVKMPARLLYYQGQRLMDQELYSEAVTNFQQAADENPGSLLGSFAHLQMGEIRGKQEKWADAQTEYRLFLAGNQNSHFTPYVLYKLVKVNNAASYTGLFFPEREVDRDQQPNRQVILDYQRFFFLYPKSIFLPEVQGYARDARLTLAEHERRVGDFYFDRGHFTAAASRYQYLLRNYPEYGKSDEVLERLILTYRRNQQPGLAEEMERMHKAQQGEAPGELPLENPGGDAGSGADARAPSGAAHLAALSPAPPAAAQDAQRP
jgi:outer membrane protein assembly factor BamD